MAEAAILAGAELALVKKVDLYCIDLYKRFKDDILVIFRDSAKLSSFIHELRKGHPFKIKCESISSSHVKFLEVGITKLDGSFSVCPEDKPSKLSVPMLSSKSSHHPSVHECWPVGQAKNRAALCSSDAIRHADLHAFVARARTHDISPSAMHTLSNMCNNPLNGNSRRSRTSSLRHSS